MVPLCAAMNAPGTAPSPSIAGPAAIPSARGPGSRPDVVTEVVSMRRNLKLRFFQCEDDPFRGNPVMERCVR